MLYNNNIFITLIYIFIIFSIIFTIIIKPQFITNDIETNLKNNNIEKFQNNEDDDKDYLKQNFEKKRNLKFETTYKKYMEGYNYHEPYINDYRGIYNHLYDVNKEDPFFTYMCVKHDISTANNILEIQNMVDELYSDFYVKTYDMYINNTTDIINKVSESINKVLISSTDYKLIGPVYIILYQSPYLRFNNDEITAKYDMNNMKPSYNQQNLNVTIGEQPLFVKMVILYPHYIDFNKNNVISKKNNNDGLTKFKTYFNDSLLSRNKLCFIECNNNNSLGCGCLNRNNPLDANDNNFYQSTCLNDKQKKTNYGMMYKINHKYMAFKDKFLDVK